MCSNFLYPLKIKSEKLPSGDTHSLSEVLSQFLLDCCHFGHVLGGGGEKTELQFVGLSHHLAE